MPRALGDLTLDEYVEVVRKGHESTPESSPAPQQASRRRLGIVLRATAVAACIVLAFVAGTVKEEKKYIGHVPRADFYQIEAANWPNELEAQKRATIAAMKQGLYMADQLNKVVLDRRGLADLVHVYALVAQSNIAKRCINNLLDSEAAGHPKAREYLDGIAESVNRPK